jgi:hypothetical protein
MREVTTIPNYNTVPDMRAYNSARVFSGARVMDKAESERHRARLMRAFGIDGGTTFIASGSTELI